MARCAACFLRRPRRVGTSAPVPAKFGDRLPRSEQHTWSAQQWGDATTFSIVEQPAGLDDQERRSQGHATNPARANPYENYRAAIWVCQLPERDSRMNSDALQSHCIPAQVHAYAALPSTLCRISPPRSTAFPNEPKESAGLDHPGSKSFPTPDRSSSKTHSLALKGFRTIDSHLVAIFVDISKPKILRFNKVHTL